MHKNKKALINRILFYGLVLVLVLFCIAFFGQFYVQRGQIQLFNQGEAWNVTLSDGTKYEQMDLSAEDFRYSLKQGEHMLVETTITGAYRGELTVRVFTRQAGLVAYVNGEPVYAYAVDKAEENQFAGTGYHFVAIPIIGGERHIQLDIVGRHGGSTNSVPCIVITKSSEAYTYFMSEHMISLFCGTFLLLLGFIITCIGIICYSIDYDYYPLLLIGLIGILCGLWSVSNLKAWEIFSMNIRLNSEIEYLALFLLPAPIMQFIRYCRECQHRSTRPINIGTIIVLGFSVVAVVLHYTGKVMFSDSLTVFHLLVGGCLILVVVGGVKNWKAMEKYEYYYLAGFFALTLSAIVSIIRYQLMRFLGIGSPVVSFRFLSLGMLFLEIMLTFGYLTYMNGRVVSRAEHEVLIQKAYEDPMTGLCNRVRGEQMMHSLDEREEREPFAIVNFDLNGLKLTNDSLGHFAGDRMLIRFAELLEEVFGPLGNAVRMSGDEFIVLVTGREKMDQIEDTLQRLVQREQETSQAEDYVMDAAYGVAYSYEFLNPKSEEVYRRADARMYEMKVASKKGRE